MSASSPVPVPERQPPSAPSSARAQLRRVAPALLLALGVAALVTAGGMGLGELTAPGPGLWPGVVAALLTATAVALLFLDPADDYEAWTAGTARIAVGLAGLALFVLLFETIGFIIPAFLLLAGWLRFFGDESWRMSLFLALAGAVVLHLVFVIGLGVPFPAGPVDQLLGG